MPLALNQGLFFWGDKLATVWELRRSPCKTNRKKQIVSNNIFVGFFVCVSFHHSTIPCLTPCLALFELKYSSAFGGLSERLLNMSWSFKVLKQISLFGRNCYFGCNNSARVTRSHVDFIEPIILRLPLARCLYIGPFPWDFEHKGQIRYYLNQGKNQTSIQQQITFFSSKTCLLKLFSQPIL